VSAPATECRVASRRAGEWLVDPGFGVYVHIPFCAKRCHYCDFNTYTGQESLHSRYVRALEKAIEEWPAKQDRPATSVYFGGGTPTLLDEASLARLLRAVRSRIGVVPDAEITVEANPETVDESVFEALLNAGFTRVSVGVQSLVPRVLAALGRTHSADAALEALRAARRAGFEDINADLIFGTFCESDEDWRISLEGVAEAAPEHISAYALTVEEGTPLATLVATGRVPDVDPDIQADRFAATQAALGGAGYRRYEISNYARPGRASAHNLLYWSAGEYAGFGAGAHGHEGGRRYWNVRLPRAYIEAVESGASTEAGSEHLQPDALAGEALVLGMRLTSGVDEAGFAARFGAPALARRQPAVARLRALGLVAEAPGRLALAPRATLVANDAFVGLL
jgi:putative oxygen-independent coproporphyrinogen III oxidase